MKKYFFYFILLCMLSSCSTQQVIRKFYNAYNEKNWEEVDKLLHPQFKGYSDGWYTTSRTEFYNQLYRDNVWSARWEIISITPRGNNAYLVRGTFVDEYFKYLYDQPVEGLWTYTVKEGKIFRLDWEKFPPNPKANQGVKREDEFRNWIMENYPDKYWAVSLSTYEAAVEFRNLLRLYLAKGD